MTYTHLLFEAFMKVVPNGHFFHDKRVMINGYGWGGVPKLQWFVNDGGACFDMYNLSCVDDEQEEGDTLSYTNEFDSQDPKYEICIEGFSHDTVRYMLERLFDWIIREEPTHEQIMEYLKKLDEEGKYLIRDLFLTGTELVQGEDSLPSLVTGVLHEQTKLDLIKILGYDK